MTALTMPGPQNPPLPPPRQPRILADGARSGRLIHCERLPARAGTVTEWPAWVPAPVREALRTAGVDQPWEHQAAAADLAWSGRSVIISTGTASGKSLGYLLPALEAVLADCTVLYIAPTRALAADQLRMVQRLGIAGVRPAILDGDTPAAGRSWARAHANYLLTTPDMLHHTLLPRHARWDGYFRRLAYVIVDECHGYRGIFGSHVAQVLRRLRRVAAHHAAAQAAAWQWAGWQQSVPRGARRRPARTMPGTWQAGRLHAAEGTRPQSTGPQGTAQPTALQSGPQGTGPQDTAQPTAPHSGPQGTTQPTAPHSGPQGTTQATAPHSGPRRAGQQSTAPQPLAGACGQAADGPVFILASATISEPARCAELLTGLNVLAVTADSAPRGELTFGLWEPPLTALRGEAGAPVRRTATAEAAALLADLVAGDITTLAFVRSRRGAEAVALSAARALKEAGSADAAGRIAAYRSGYLADDRRAIEAAVQAGEITGLAATTALELGVNIGGLDAVLIAGWPGTRAALWQQAGRAGRAGRDSLAILIARDDPLDTYLVHHPEAILHRPVEATVLDPANPYVLAPHLCAAAAELPLTAGDAELFGQPGRELMADLERRGMLRRKGDKWYWTRLGRAPLTGLRGTGERPIRIVEEETGRLIGTVDEPSAHVLVHAGAVYPHQGEMYVVSTLDLDNRIALVQPGDPGYVTSAREVTGIAVGAEQRRADWGAATVHFGDVQVTRQVIGFVRHRLDSGQLIGHAPLDLPPRTLHTRAVWWTLSAGQRAELAAAGVDLSGAAHAAEHASIGMLPLVAACDRWDVGGVSTDLHPATGRLTVFVYDGHDGGAGFAERGFTAAREWLTATATAIESCECTAGCPSCIQSPKCGNGNEPLAKAGAVTLLRRLLDPASSGAG